MRARWTSYRLLHRATCLLVALAFFVLVPARPRRAQTGSSNGAGDSEAYRTAMEGADQKIAAEVQAHSELMKNLEYLTTEIGPRLTGSPQMQKASEWTLQRFHDYGLDAHLEMMEVLHAWYRGDDSAEIMTPIQRRVSVRSIGWSSATSGEANGAVVFLVENTVAEVDRQKDKLKGAIVCVNKPATLPAPSEVPDNAYDAVIPPPRGVPSQAQESSQDRRRITQILAEAGAAVVLLDSGKADSLFNMRGSSARPYEPSLVPSALLTHEDFSLLYRLWQAGPVTMKVNLKGTLSPGPASAAITVAEIRGSEFSDQRVIIGGHLDSWDLGQGALDNGTGAMAVLEAARTLKALAWSPKRTLTFLLFTGEEEGGDGVRLFLKNHEAEVPKMDAVLVHDSGTGRVFSIGLEELYETAPLLARIYQPLQEVFDLKPLSMRFFGSSDHVPFLQAGVPAYLCVQSPAHYREAHHSQADTFDKIIPEEINEGAAVLAAWAWNVSELPQALPHHTPGSMPDPPSPGPAIRSQPIP